MVAQLLRLRLTLLGNVLRRSPWQLVGILISLVYGLVVAWVMVSGLVALRSAEVELAGSILTVAGSVIVLGFLLLPLAFGVDDTMDPRKFGLYGIATPKLATGLAIAALVGVPALVMAVIGIAQVVTWSRDPLAVILAIVGAVLIVATCVLAARVTTATAAFLLSSRRSRDVAALVALVGVIAVIPGVTVLASVDWRWQGIGVLSEFAAVLGWTPLGAVWAAPAAAAEGDVGAALLKMLIAIAFVAVLWFAWQLLVRAMLLRPEGQSQARSYAGLGWFSRFPASSFGAIAARTLTYWVRDSRYRTSLVIVPILPVLIVLPLIVAGAPDALIAFLPVPIMCLFLSWSVHNDIASDNTAFWSEVAAGTPGLADRWGRAVPVLLLGIPLAILGSMVSVALLGDATVLPALMGLSICILFAGLGLSSIVSASFPYPTVHPGDSPFAQPQSSGSAASVIQAFSLIAVLVLAAPVIWLTILGFENGGQWHVVALAVGIVLGLLFLVSGMAWGARIFEKRSPEILAFTMRN